MACVLAAITTRSRLGAVVGHPRRGGVAVIVLAVVGVELFGNPGPPVASPTPTNTRQSKINFTIRDSLSSVEVAETTTVYSFGREVGKLQINRSQPNASLSMFTDGTNVDYQLEIALIATDGKQYTITGTGEIAVYEGAVYTVAISKDSAGNFTATLQPMQGGA
jgi:hypothetical protein